MFIFKCAVLEKLHLMIMMIALISRTHKGEKERGEVNGEYGGIQGKEKGDADYG